MPDANQPISWGNFPTLIIGGGVIGLSLAWQLAQRGERVTVVDSGPIGRGASWAGAGILPPVARANVVDPYEQLRSLSHQLHAEWAEQLQRVTGIDTGYRRCGGIYLASTIGEQATLAANHWWWQEHGVTSIPLDATTLATTEPQLARFARERFRSAWLLPDECQVRNPRQLKALAAACTQLGVKLLAEQAVERLEPSGEGVRVFAQGQWHNAGKACICSGAWARQTLLDLGIDNGIMPVRGQMVMYATPEPLLAHVVNEGHRYLVPRQDGRILAGSVEEEVGYENETTTFGIAHIQQWAEGVLPALAAHPVERTWSGLRPGSYDSLPYLGRVPGTSNLYVAAGHFRSGLHLSCATAVVIADLMTGSQPTVDLHPFRVGR